MIDVDSRLVSLAHEANEELARANGCFQSGLEHAERAGAALNKAKRLVPHGQWGRWLAENFNGSARCAQLYMQIARHKVVLDDELRNDVASLSLREAAAMIATPRAIQIHVREEVVESPRISIRVTESEPQDCF